MESSQILAVLPLRLESTRIKKKMLATIGSRTLCEHSISAALRAFEKTPDVQVVAAVDSPQVSAVLKKSFPHLQIIETSPEIPTGTDRVFESYRILKNRNPQINYKAILNIQGDMPFMGASGLQSIAQFFRDSSNEILKKYPIATLCQPWPTEKSNNQNYNDAGAVKILRNKEGAAIYFSRLPVPYSKLSVPKKGASVFGELHLGVYGFTPEALSRFCAQSPTELELAEGLEQMRALWLGYTIFGIETAPLEYESYRGIDTSKDLSWAKVFAKPKSPKKIKKRKNK